MVFGNESHSASKEEFCCSLLILLSPRVDLLEGLRQLTVLRLLPKIIHGSGQLTSPECRLGADIWKKESVYGPQRRVSWFHVNCAGEQPLADSPLVKRQLNDTCVTCSFSLCSSHCPPCSHPSDLVNIYMCTYMFCVSPLEHGWNQILCFSILLPKDLYHCITMMFKYIFEQ